MVPGHNLTQPSNISLARPHLNLAISPACSVPLQCKLYYRQDIVVISVQSLTSSALSNLQLKQKARAVLFYSTQSQESKSQESSLSQLTVVRFELCCRACHRRSSSCLPCKTSQTCPEQHPPVQELIRWTPFDRHSPQTEGRIVTKPGSLS